MQGRAFVLSSQYPPPGDFDFRGLEGTEDVLYFAHIQKLKNDFSMELTIIETSAYQELRRLVSTLAVQMGDFQKKIAPPAPDK